MSKGSYYKTMDANRRVHFQAWKEITNKRINHLNTITGEKHCYCLAYRGRNHSIVLLDSSTSIARGMININQVLDLLERRYKDELEKMERSEH